MRARVTLLNYGICSPARTAEIFFHALALGRIKDGRTPEGPFMEAGDDRDEYLMARVAHNQPELLERLLRRHASPLLTFIQRMVGDRHRSEELFQEVFLAVWVKRQQYTYPRPFKPWLYAIALNKCRAAFRLRSHPVVALPDEDGQAPPATEAAPPESAMAAESAALVSRAVTLLPPAQRAVVVLRIWDGLPYADIADIVGRTEATVRSHMHHGLAALRKYLEPRLGVGHQ
jgi:RNA polymerase sigma-70 factor (ECF subfamily)